MTVRRELGAILASDPRYALAAYQFVMDALVDMEIRRRRALFKARKRGEKRPKRTRPAAHVAGPALCTAVRDLAARQFGLLAPTVLAHWGIRSTSDIGEVVFHLIEAGELLKGEDDNRADFDDVFDLTEAFARPELAFAQEVS